MQPTPTSITSQSGRSGFSSSIDLIDLFWRRRTYVVVGTVIGIVASIVYCLLATPMYESSADVLVVQKRPQVVTGDTHYESGFEDYLATHLAIMVSPVIVERAIAASSLASLASFADIEDPEEDLVDAIIGDLEVEGGSRDLGESADSIMTLYYRSPVPEDAPIVVQALLDSYEAFHHEVYRGMSDSSMELIGQARDLLENDLSVQEDNYSQFRQSSPLVANGNEEVNPLQERLASIETRRSEVLLRRSELESQLRSLQEARDSGVTPEQLIARVTEMRQQATSEHSLPNHTTALENQLIGLLDNEQGMLEHYGPNHPHVMTMRQRIADTRRLFALPTTAHVADTGTAGRSDDVSDSEQPVALYTAYLQQEIKSLKIAEELLADLYDRQHEDAKELSIYQLRDSSFRRGIERTEALYDVVLNRLQEASLVKDYGGFETSVIAPPRQGMKVGPRRRIALPVGAFLGLLVGCSLALVVELRDDSFQSCDQIQQQLALPVLGQIPRYLAAETQPASSSDGQDAAIDPMVCSYHGPRTIPAEAFRNLRTALLGNGADQSCRVVQLTGVNAGDGASTVAANLAVSLAQAGKRVLLINADRRGQRVHEMFGLAAPATGLSTVITTEGEPADAICQTAITNLSLLPLGPDSDGPQELYTTPRFGELINWVRDEYDHVLIDTEPLLAASDPFVIASHTDGVVLVLRLGHDARRSATQAGQMMDRLGVRVLGIIVNQLGHRALDWQRPSATARSFAAAPLETAVG